MGCLDQSPPPFHNQQEYNEWLYEQLVNLDGCVPDTPDGPECKEETLTKIDIPASPFPPADGQVNWISGEDILVGAEWTDVFEVGDSIWIEGEEYEITNVENKTASGGDYVLIEFNPEVPQAVQDLDEVVFASCEPEGDDKCPMVFYGVKPPDEAPVGAIFTDENSIKSFVHRGEGVWIEHTPCVGNDEGGDDLTPWIRIEELRVVRQYYGPSQSNSPDGFVAKIMIYEFHYEDELPSTITQEWEWDEVGDGNWVPLDLMSDPNITADGYQTYYYWLYNWAPENLDDNTGLDPAHPFPCAKVRVRMNNAWDDGTNEDSEWMECWIGKAASPTYGTTHQPPSIC